MRFSNRLYFIIILLIVSGLALVLGYEGQKDNALWPLVEEVSKKVLNQNRDIANPNVITPAHDLLKYNQHQLVGTALNKVKTWHFISVILLAMLGIAMLIILKLNMFINRARLQNRSVYQKSELDNKGGKLGEQLNELQLMASIFDANESIIVTDSELKILKVNKAFSSLTGYNEAEVIGRSPSILSSGRHDASFYRSMWHKLQSEGAWSGEIIDKRKDGSLFTGWLSISAIYDDLGNVSHYLSHTNDISVYKSSQAAFNRRIRLEKIISELTLTALKSTENELNIIASTTLQQLGSELAADRSYIFEFFSEENSMSNSYEWCAKGIEPMIDMLQNIPVEPYSWSLSQLYSDHIVAIDDVDTMPDEAKADKVIFLQQSIQSLLLIPIMREGNLIAFFGFDRVKEKRGWRKEDKILLRMVADVLSAIKYREEGDCRQRLLHKKTLSLLQENMKLLDANRQLTVNIVATQESERKFLAQELHDEFGQVVTGIRLDAEFLQTLPSLNAEANSVASSIEILALKMITMLRVTTRRLRTATLEHFGLLPAIKELVSDWDRYNHTVSCKLTISCDSCELSELSDASQTSIYRAIQEALTNISKYAQAENVDILIMVTRKEKIILEIKDDGVGIRKSELNKGYGLLGMKERLLAIDGTIDIVSPFESGGTHVRIEVPLDAIDKTLSDEHQMTLLLDEE